MIKKRFYIYILVPFLVLVQKTALAQDNPQKTDTFFLAKKKGLLGRFGQSISRTPPDEEPAKVENSFLKYNGKIIRSIETIRLGFEYDIDDTTRRQENFGITVGKVLHKNTRNKVIRKNLFFKEGDLLYPYLFADNERYLRDLTFIKDARILVDFAIDSQDSVDVVVLTKDVFSIGANLSISSLEEGRAELREENLGGSGDQIMLRGYHEKQRSPQTGVGGEFLKRNIGGSFINWVSGYQDYGNAFSSNRNQETVVYSRLEKPLVTPYIPTTGALEWAYRRTRNVYDSDSLYRADIKYHNYNIDGWFGYSLDNMRSLYENKQIRVHRFVAVRGFKQHFTSLPAKYIDSFDYRFTDFTGGLASLNIFKQVFYRSSFVYGFGLREDIPEGFSAAITAGYVSKQNINRPYSGIDLALANFRKKGFYSSYTLRFGGYFFRQRFEDVDILFDVNHFTRLRKLSATWYNRIFIGTGITAQINPVLNTPLFANSEFGLPYFNNGSLNSDLRATVKAESVFYNTTKILGFRLAPFVFTDLIMLKPTKLGLQHSDIFTVVGGGIRTRNENLVFGTIELKGFYFPRTNGNQEPWKVELSSNIRFKFRSSFISRPNLIISN